MIKGSLVPNITIFDKNGKTDFEKTKWHMTWMFENGVDGLFLTGSYGSGPLMTNQERIEIYELAYEVVKGFSGKYLIAHVGCADTKSTVELAQAAEKIGIGAIGAVPPFYYKYEADKIVQYYKDIVESVTIPVYAYNNPETTRFAFDFNTVDKIQKAGVKGIKDSSMNVGFITRIYYDSLINKKDFKVIIGTSTGWLPFYYMGIDTMIAGMCNYAPEVIYAMYNWTLSGQTEKAEKAYKVMLELVGKFKFTDSTIASHMALYARGFDAGYPRKPMMLPPFSDPKYEELKNAIHSAIEQINVINSQSSTDKSKE
jgi:dihydrodipicolinate synthase/N-acetylneuraminate lyase